MAQKTDIAAAKARKQKIILAAAGVLLVGIAVLQVPKLMKSNSQPAAAPAATAPVATGATTPATAVVVSSSTGTLKPAAYVAGVALPGGSVVVVADKSKSQLASFTLFEAKDPFVQQGGSDTSTSTAAVTPSTDTAAPTATGSDTAATGNAGTGTTPAPPPVIYATVMLDGKPQQLKVKQQFPKGAPLFVLASVKKKQAKIGVAGGSFDNGQTVTLTLGKTVTLVDTATGVRYELKLVYTGATPETIESFSTTTDQPAAPAGGSSTASAAPTATATATP
jgi:hypothetical protein